MRVAELKRAVEAALALLAAEPGIREAEVFAAANRSLVTRPNCTIVWAADEIVYAPELAMSGVHMDEIAGGSMVTHER